MHETSTFRFSLERLRFQQVLFFLVLLGVLFEVAFLFQPSEPENAWLLGYSRSRVLLVAGMALAVGMAGFLLIAAWKKQAWFEAGIKRLETFLSQPAENLAWVTFSLSGLFLFLATGVILSLFPLSGDWGALPVVLLRLRPVLLWGIVVCLSLLFLLAESPSFYFLWSHINLKGVLWRFGLVSLGLVLTFLQWMVMSFQLPLYTHLEGWFFYFRPRVDHEREWVFLILLAGSLGLAVFLRRLKRFELALLLWMGWAYVLQLGFMWIEWGSLGRMVEKYVLRYASYANAIAKNPPFLEIIRNYETIYGENLFAATKPPGFMLIYWLLHNASMVLSEAGLAIRLNHLVTFGFPLLAVLMVWPLFMLSQSFLEREQAFFPIVLYFSFPGVLLISLFPDQAIYPSMFVFLTWLTILLTERGRFYHGMVVGGLLYLAIFLSFALLPLLFFVMSLIWLYWVLFGRTRATFQRTILLTFGVGIGFAGVYWLFKEVLGYDALLRYQQAMTAHALAKGYQAQWKTLPGTVMVNFFDFALGAGWAMPMLWLIVTAASLSKVMRGAAERTDWLALAFFGMVVFLNLAGQTRSETARLWLFLLPLMAVLVTDFFSRFFRSSWLYWFLFFQLWTTFFVYRFQRLY